MDLNLYRIFLEVAKTGSISKAASSLFVLNHPLAIV